MQYEYNPVVVTASGTWTGDTLSILGGICCQVYAKSTSVDTTFDLKIENRSGIEIRKYTNVVNLVNDLSKWSVQDVLTVTIENATNDEAFDVLIVVEEF